MESWARQVVRGQDDNPKWSWETGGQVWNKQDTVQPGEMQGFWGTIITCIKRWWTGPCRDSKRAEGCTSAQAAHTSKRTSSWEKIFNCPAKMDDQECNLLDAQMNSSIPWGFGMSVVQERFGLFFKESWEWLEENYIHGNPEVFYCLDWRGEDQGETVVSLWLYWGCQQKRRKVFPLSNKIFKSKFS